MADDLGRTLRQFGGQGSTIVYCNTIKVSA